MEIGQTDSAGVESAGCRRKRLLLQGFDCGKSGVLDDTCDVRPSNNAPLKADCKENSRQPKQDALYEESDGDGMLPKNANEESIYVLDATKEGNVGRFLNVSTKLHDSLCCLCKYIIYLFKFFDITSVGDGPMTREAHVILPAITSGWGHTGCSVAKYLQLRQIVHRHICRYTANNLFLFIGMRMSYSKVLEYV